MEDKHTLGCRDYDKAFEAWNKLCGIAHSLNLDIDDIIRLSLDYIYYSNFESVRAKGNIYDTPIDLLETKE